MRVVAVFQHLWAEDEDNENSEDEIETDGPLPMKTQVTGADVLPQGLGMLALLLLNFHVPLLRGVQSGQNPILYTLYHARTVHWASVQEL